MQYKILLYILLTTIIFTSSVFAFQNETMTVEVNVYAEILPSDYISIEVPDYVFLGNVTGKDATDKAKVYINNTGSVNITITPQLVHQNDVIFQNLYFQTRQTGNSSKVYQIGEYHYNMTAPSTLGGKRSDYFYMWIDLTDYSGTISSNYVGKKEDILFVALPQR